MLHLKNSDPDLGVLGLDLVTVVPVLTLRNKLACPSALFAATPYLLCIAHRAGVERCWCCADCICFVLACNRIRKAAACVVCHCDFMLFHPKHLTVSRRK